MAWIRTSAWMCGWMLGVAGPLSGCTLDNKSIGDEGDSSGSAEDGGGTPGGDGSSDGNDGTETDGGDDSGETMPTDTGVDTDDGSSDGIVACTLPPLLDQELNNLTLYSNRLGKVAVGDTQTIGFGQFGGGGLPDETDACKEWSVSPADAATIDDDGLLTISETAAPGTIVTVTVDVEDGRAILNHDIEVYEPNGAAIVGSWAEATRLLCPDFTEIDPILEQRVNEVVFFDSGDFFVTWQPFETYVDYWGTYTYDNDTEVLAMTVDGGNYEPADVDLEGEAGLDSKQLILLNMFFGSSQEGPVTDVCGHVLE